MRLATTLKRAAMRRLKDKIWLQLIVIYTRYLIGGAFVFASIIKIKGQRFTSKSGAAEPINSAFHFFETMYASGLYWIFLGLGQLLAGFLLMTQRYSKLGDLGNLPIILNVFVITISYSFGLTPIIVALMLLANIGLIVWEWDELKSLIILPFLRKAKTIENYPIWEITGYFLFAFTFVYRILIDQYDSFFWMLICFLIGIAGLIFGLKQIRSVEFKS